MKRLLSFAIALLCITRSLQAEEPVYFASANLKAAVEGELMISDPTPTEMLELVSLDANSRPIADLTGLGYAVNLWSLNLMHIHNSDFSVLAFLSELEILNLRWNEISDISYLSGLDKLMTLELGHNQISDISGLSGLTHLYTLGLDENEISDVSPLSGLTELSALDLEDNDITDISPLRALTSLRKLDLRGNPLGRDAYENDLLAIAANNPGIFLSYDAETVWQMVVSSSTGGDVLRPGCGTFKYDDGAVVLLEAQADPCFVFVGWSGTCSTTQNPTHVLLDHDHEVRARFLSTLSTLHVDDDGPHDPGLGDAAISDPGENGTADHPFDRIQEAIEVAASDATVRLAPGTYHENVDLLGKSICLMGFDPDDPNISAYPVLDGPGSGPVLQCTQNEDPNCLIMGLFITRTGPHTGPAVLCSQSSPSLANCLIVGHRIPDPDTGVVTCIDSQALLVNCTIADNEGRALALEDSAIVLTQSILWGNLSDEIRLAGDSEPSITYCDVAGGWPDVGNIDADPMFVGLGSWTDPNDPQRALGPDDPGAIWVPGDYHLRSRAGRWDPLGEVWVRDETSSPCIDAGDPSSALGAEPEPNGAIVNIGAYGATNQAARSTVEP